MERPDYSDNLLRELSTESLVNFYQRCKKELDDLWDVFQWNKEFDDEILGTNEGPPTPYRVLFLETLYTYRIAEDEIIEYEQFLHKRVKDV